jgi:hypothetical protein
VPFFEIDFISVINVDPDAPESDKTTTRPEFSSRQNLGHVDHKNRKSKITNSINIRTIAEGFNSGRAYCIRFETGAECRRIAAELRAFSMAARHHFELRTPLRRYQERLKLFYDSAPCQAFVGLLIISVRIVFGQYDFLQTADVSL